MTTLTLKGRSELGQSFTAVLIERSNQTDAVGHGRTTPCVVVGAAALVQEVTTVAGTVDVITVEMQVLEITAVAGNTRAQTGHWFVLSVLRNHVLSTAKPYGAASILNVKVEAPHPFLAGLWIRKV